MSAFLHRAPGIAWDSFDDEAVLVDTAGGRVFVLNAAAAWVWRCCDGATTPRQMAERLTPASERERLAPHIQAFCRKLKDAGLVLEAHVRHAVGSTTCLAPPVLNYSVLGGFIMSDKNLGRPPRPLSPGGGSVPP